MQWLPLLPMQASVEPGTISRAGDRANKAAGCTGNGEWVLKTGNST